MSRTTTLLGLLSLAAAALGAGFMNQTASPRGDDAKTTTVARRPRAIPATASFRFQKADVDRSVVEDASPISLTASDGTGLALVGLEASGVLEPPLAFTELHLTFENPRDETIEGRFRIALPPGAALSRFAMKIGGSWQEGEVVERQKARRAYEDFLHLRQDPALLEQEAGNEFSARVFPIPARSRKELIVSYSHAMARSDERYVLPLHGLSEIGQLDIRVLLGDRPAADSEASNLGGEVSDRRVVELHKRAWTPDRDFEIAQSRIANRAGLRQGNLAVVRVAPEVDAQPQEIAGLYVLVDSSASRALGYATQVQRLAELAGGLRDGAGGSTPLAVAAFDQEVVPIYEGTAGGFGADEAQRLGARRPLGASDLDRALGWLAKRLGESGGKYPRVLLITDGVATAGDTETRALKAAVRALGAHGVERLDVLAVGGLRDEAALHELITGNLAHDGQRIDGAASLSEIARRLTLACRSGLKVEVEGAGWVWPETLNGVQPGDEVLVYADLPQGRALRLKLAGQPVELGDLAPAERPLLERAWVQARIERLLHLREAALGGDDDLRKALGLQVAELSVKHRVLSPFTAMLVLETEGDYARYGLDRRGLSDILTVGPAGLDVLARKRPDLPQRNEEAVAKRRDFRALPWERPAADLSPPPPPGAAEGEDFDGSVEGGVEGGIVGGVVGGVVGGTPGGVPGGVASGAAIQPSEVPEALPDAPARLAPRMEAAAPRMRRDDAPSPVPSVEDEEERKHAAPYNGHFAEVMDHLAAGRVSRARTVAEGWIEKSPGDVLALLALGEVWETAGEKDAAARAYGSLIDLFPSRADMRRLAGERLERLGKAGLELAIDTYQKAVLDRPDHATGHRLLAWVLLRAGRFADAFAALEKGLEQEYPQGRFAGLDQVMKEDLGLLASAWLRAEPDKRQDVLDRLHAQGAQLASEPSLRFVLSWETDANDVDLHVYDRRGGHAYYGDHELPSGGQLYADVTTGYGPECFAVTEPPDRDAAPYKLAVHYYRRGPMGYGMGIVHVVGHDGKGDLTVDARPFVVMTDDAMVDVGSVTTGRAVRAAGK
jgi:tetratricopeptide (TPR) repeat protein